MANLQRKFQREIQERLSIRRRSIGSIFGKKDDKHSKNEPDVQLSGSGAVWPSPEPGNFVRSFRHSTSEKKLRSTSTSGTASFKRRNSLAKMKQPLANLRGSIRSKIRDSRRRSMMKGKQDYSARSSINGLVDFCRFLTAQDSKTDLSLIDAKRQELQQKIEHEVKMHDGCAKLLAVSKRPAQKLEAAKNLITSNSRIQACMSEMQLLKSRTDRTKKQPPIPGERNPCGSTLSVSDIRIPLIWRDSDKDHRKYSAFCLFRVGTDIQATSMISDIHKYDTDICITDTISFNDAAPDFDLEVEIYCHKQESETSFPKTPKKFKRHFNEISNTIGKSMGRRLSGVGSGKVPQEDMRETEMVLGPKFELIARGCLGLSDISNVVNSFDLRVEETTTHEVSLYGHFCCRLTAQPYCVTQEVHTGMLLLRTKRSEEWSRYFCTLKNQTLSGWKGRNEADVLPPAVAIPVHANLQVSLPTDKTDDGLSHFFIHGTAGKVKYVCALENEGELLKWYEGILQLMYDQSKWQHACAKPSHKVSGMGARTRSQSRILKEEKSFSVDSPMTKMLNRLNVSN